MIEISDNQNRKNDYRSDRESKSWLNLINERLEEHPAKGRRPEAPILFVTGSPRSGTTITAQALCRFLDVGFIDNLAAKFWKAPVTGLRLSQATFGADRTSCLSSQYGRTEGSDIHGFHYFWMEQLKLDNADSLFSNPRSRGVDWDGICAHIAMMQSEAGKPFLFKGYYPSYFMADVCRNIPNSVFIITDRDPLPQALSILEARERILKDPGMWWSMIPPNVEVLIGAPLEDQIIGQILGINGYFRDQIARAGGSVRYLYVKYEELVDNPAKTLARTHERVAALTGMEIGTRASVPVIEPRKALDRENPWLKKFAEKLALAEYMRAED